MSVQSSDRTIQVAARWYARLQASDCTAAERAEFARWCDSDSANAAAYAAARDMAAEITRAAATNERLRAMTAAALAAGPGRPGRVPGQASGARRRGFAVAAALAASVAATFVGAFMLSAPSEPEEQPVVAHLASEGATRVIRLDDGSVVHLDVTSVLDVKFTSRLREVTLQRGRAVFDVAHDTSRPFVVVAGNERVTAVGTKFQVARSLLETVVTLAEGIVTVSGEPGGAQRTERLAPGDELKVVEGGDSWVMRTVDPRVATSWSTGRLVFRDARLGDALQEVNRYAARKVRLRDESLADLRVSGNFVAGDSQTAVTAFAAVLPLEVLDVGDELLVYQRQ